MCIFWPITIHRESRSGQWKESGIFMIVVSVSYIWFQSMISYHCIQLNKTGTNVIIIIITHQNIICAAITLKNNANLHSLCVCVSLARDHKSKFKNNSYRHDVGFRFFLICFTRCLSQPALVTNFLLTCSPTHTRIQQMHLLCTKNSKSRGKANCHQHHCC